MKVPFRNLCLGAKFAYEEGLDRVYVKIDNRTVAAWDPAEVSTSWVGQGIFSFNDNDDFDQEVYLVREVRVVEETVEDQTERKLAAVTAPDNGSTEEVLAAVLECARAWVPEARIMGNVRAGDIARVVADVLAESMPLTPSPKMAVTEAAKRYLSAIDSEPEKDIWDTWDGKRAEGASRSASDWSWAEHGKKIEACLADLRAAVATDDKLTAVDIETLKACDDWKATFEVIAIKRLPSCADTYRAEQHRIDALLERGLLEFGRPNTTYRTTAAGRAALAATERK